jgi:AcrR family transcriptional regulator
MRTDTRTRLMDGAIEALRTHGIAGVSARTIATAAGASQALVFYHFGSVDELLTAACLRSTEQEVEAYRERFAAVSSLRELQTVGREMYAESRDVGNVAVLAQLLAGAQTNPGIAAAMKASLDLWFAQIETTLARVLADSPIADIADSEGLARALSASFIGLELLAGVDPDSVEKAFDALDQFGAILEYFDGLGSTARRAVRVAVRRTVGNAGKKKAASA